MFVAHIVLGLIGGVLAAGWAWLGAGVSIWWAVAVYVVSGNALCLASVAVALMVAARRPAGRHAAAPTELEAA